MKAVSANKLKRFWEKGVIPIKNSLASKVNTSDIVNNFTTTVANKVADARAIKTLKDQLDTQNSTLAEVNRKFGMLVDFVPIVFAVDGSTEKYAGGYTTRVATRKTIGARVFMDIWISMNNIGTLGTGDLELRIKGTGSGNVPIVIGKGLVYSASISYLSGVASGVNVSAAISSGKDYISLYNGGGFLKAKNITKDFQIRLSISYDIA